MYKDLVKLLENGEIMTKRELKAKVCVLLEERLPQRKS